ncbi:ankyrin, partial [Piromyces finnis]
MNKLKGFKYVNLEDNNGNTALFYAIDSIVIFQKLVDRGADYNHFNRNGENVLMYACRKNKLRLFDYVLKIPDFNVAQFDNFGRNLPMILVECNHSQELISFYNYHSDFDINFVNKSNESLLSIFINHYISELKEKDELIKTKYYEVIRDYGLMIRALVESGCDFNAYIDGDGNTPMMFFLLIEDYVSAYYLLTKFPKLDLSIKNKYNANASYMAF